MSPQRKKRPPEDDYVGSLAWFVVALGLSEDQQRDVVDRARAQGHKAAVHSEATAVRGVWSEVDALQAGGVPLEEGKAQLAEGLRKAWGDGQAEPWRVFTLANLVTQFAYQRGRWKETHRSQRRVLRYSAALEPRTCDYCRGLHGTTLPADDAWWQGHYPPQHSRCLCLVHPVADEATPTESPSREPPDEGFGMAPGVEWAPDYGGFPPEIAAMAAAKG